MEILTYFGYGSNMLTVKLKSRCCSVKILGVYWTKDYTLKFHKRSTDGSGKGNMAPVNGETDELYGIVFTINKDDEVKLDAAEGLGYGYKKKSIKVTSEKTNESLMALTYYAAETHIDDNLKPYRWYKTQTLVGAKEHGLPPHYIKEKIENVNDKPCTLTRWHCFHDQELWKS